MTRAATMGTSSCATFAIAGFKQDHIDENEKYRADPDNYVLDQSNFSTKYPGKGTVGEWFSEFIGPTSQPLGATKDYPFDMLMEEIKKHGTCYDKFTIATLNEFQQEGNDQYWPKRLTEHGFELIDKTQNNMGTVCYVYTRNFARVE